MLVLDMYCLLLAMYPRGIMDLKHIGDTETTLMLRV